MRKTLFVFALAMLSIGAFLSYSDKVGGASATYAAAFLCLFFVYLPEFELFKAFGAEARLRKKINEADEILQRLREMTLPIVELLCEIDARVGRWSGPVPRRDRYRIMKQIEEELRRIGVRPEGLKKAKRIYDRANINGLAQVIIEGFINLLDSKQGVGKTESVKLREVYYLEDAAMLPSAIEDYINKCEFLSKEEKEEFLNQYQEEIDDLKYYIKHHDFRRLEQWFRKEEEKIETVK